MPWEWAGSEALWVVVGAYDSINTYALLGVYLILFPEIGKLHASMVF